MGDELRLTNVETTAPYTALAAGYDFVMSHVDYEMWAEYVNELLVRHRPEAHSILELGCGTGSLAVELQMLGSFDYLATDGSESMLREARRKAAEAFVKVDFDVAHFTDYHIDPPRDAVILLYDGLNYLLDQADIRSLLACTFEALKPGGVFIVDQSTPANSLNNEAYFESSDSQDGFSYVRRSRYEASTKLHRTVLEMSIGDRSIREEHVQRAYEIEEMRRLIDAAGFAVAAAYDGFSTEPASEKSERVHWVLRRPK